MQSRYEKLAPFTCGRAILETGKSADTDKFKNKRRVALLPLDKFVEYLNDPAGVRRLWEAAGAKLVERYNAQVGIKTHIDWRDEMCRYHFTGFNGKREMTAWEVRFHTYGFWVSDLFRPIERSDLTVRYTS
jgi:hypothetical protein